MTRPMPRSITLLLGTIALAALVTAARAEPYRPADPSLVLLRIAPAAARGTERRVDSPGHGVTAGSAVPATGAGTSTTPDSLNRALASAAAFIELGRRTSQPQGFGRAEALLETWRSRAVASAQWHVLLADVYQYRHDYPRALALLDNALRLEAQHVRARLMRAAIHQTNGSYQPARADCAAVLGNGEQALGTACLAQVLGLTGRLQQAYALLERQQDSAGAAPGVRVWILTALADMAERRGNVTTAENHLRAALVIAPRDAYVHLALADLLLESERAALVEDVLDELPVSSATLLRRVEARRALGLGFGQAIVDLQRGLKDARERGEETDWREMARLNLALGQCGAALAAARRNWKMQREPIDVRLFERTAAECGDDAARLEIRCWRLATHYEDAGLQTWSKRRKTT